jgi:hypothetical protein
VRGPPGRQPEARTLDIERETERVADKTLQA